MIVILGVFFEIHDTLIANKKKKISELINYKLTYYVLPNLWKSDILKIYKV